MKAVCMFLYPQCLPNRGLWLESPANIPKEGTMKLVRIWLKDSPVHDVSVEGIGEGSLRIHQWYLKGHDWWDERLVSPTDYFRMRQPNGFNMLLAEQIERPEQIVGSEFNADLGGTWFRITFPAIHCGTDHEDVHEWEFQECFGVFFKDSRTFWKDDED